MSATSATIGTPTTSCEDAPVPTPVPAPAADGDDAPAAGEPSLEERAFEAIRKIAWALAPAIVVYFYFLAFILLALHMDSLGLPEDILVHKAKILWILKMTSMSILLPVIWRHSRATALVALFLCFWVQSPAAGHTH